MKLKLTLFSPLIFALLLPLDAQEPASGGSAAEVEEELPEVSDPPYSIGDMATIQGHYISLADGVSLNFRIINNRMRVYWLDVDGLIVEPQAKSGNVRFVASVRGPIYYGMALLEGEDGLGSLGGPVWQPHRFTVILNLEKADSKEFETYTFRYTPAMADIRETREFDDSDSVDSSDAEDKGSRYY